MSTLAFGYYITAELIVNDISRIVEAKEALSILCTETLKESGCSIFQLHQDATTPERFLLWERFETEEAFRQHFEEQHTKSYVALGLTTVVRYFQTNLIST